MGNQHTPPTEHFWIFVTSGSLLERRSRLHRQWKGAVVVHALKLAILGTGILGISDFRLAKRVTCRFTALFGPTLTVPYAGAGYFDEDGLENRKAPIDDTKPGFENAPVSDLAELVGEV
jgi:hypothetical protein